MALYEGIALIQEKQAVVLDLGYDYTKFGFTGEAAPRCIVRSEFWDAATRSHRRLHDYDSPEQLYDNLVQMLHSLYFRHVLVNPKERKVVVVESLMTPTLFRETLAKVLFTHYEVSGAVWADSARLAALSLGAHTALVLDVGAREAEATPLAHAAVLLPALQSAPLGLRALRAELRRLLDEDNGRALALSDRVLEDIQVKTCFVTSRARAQQWAAGAAPSPPAPPARYPLPGGPAILVSSRARELAAEVMFARDLEAQSLPELVLAALARSPRDTRRALAASLYVCGGGAALPGLLPRLQDELRHLLAEEPWKSTLFIDKLKFHRSALHGNVAAWCGGAVLGAAGGAVLGAAGGAGRALVREEWARAPRLRDWTCLLDNTPHDHPCRADHDRM